MKFTKTSCDINYTISKLNRIKTNYRIIVDANALNAMHLVTIIYFHIFIGSYIFSEMHTHASSVY